MGLIGCSEEQSSDSKARLTMEVVPCAPMFIEEQMDDFARAWTTPEEDDTRSWATGNDTRSWATGHVTRTATIWEPPTGYVTYDAIYGTNGLFATQRNLTNKSIKAFFIKYHESTIQAGTFSYKSTENNWQLSEPIEQDGNFNFYGYIPSEAASQSSNITGNSTFAEGAVMHLNGINTVTPNDVCVIIGAKNGAGAMVEKEDDKYTVTGLQAGQFLVAAKASTLETPGSGNYIFLLFDHLYSSLRFNFTVDEDYDALRTIRLRKLEMIPYSDGNKTLINAKYNATVKLKANTNNTNPITEVTFEGDQSSGNATFEPLFNGEEKLEHGKFTCFMGCFVPGETKHFLLRSTYDVYDKNTDKNEKGNLIRQGCVAENYIDLPNMLNVSNVQRGHMYAVTLKVRPTYLYVMSEPDVDNPTVVVN